MLFTVALAVASANMAMAATTSYASRAPESTIQPSQASILAAQATAVSLSPTSNVKGLAFDRIIQIWLENTDYSLAAGDPNMQYLASQGITLTNYWSTTHPSEPNYAAVVAGDHFGMDNDDFNAIPSNISTVVDLLDTKGISWGEYQEDQPYVGFQGFAYVNQKTAANDYVRKHNPLVLFDSVANNATRLSLIKNLTAFDKDVQAKTLPQWSFVTPNMTSDGHDTSVTTAGAWTRAFLAPYMNNTYVQNNTLIIITFDENETYTIGNKIFTIVLGGAVPASLHGTTDNTFYNHYSNIASVSSNWGLPSLGRWDCSANIFQTVANKTGYTNAKVDTTGLYFNASYPGPLSDKAFVPTWPLPATNAKCANGLGVLPSIVKTWGASNGTFNYATGVYPYDTVSGSNVVAKSNSTVSTATATTSAAATGTSKAAATTSAIVNVSGASAVVGSAMAAVVAAFAAFMI